MSHSGSIFSDDEEDVCPLCVEEMDITDKNFKPCPCGYQICQFCYNNIRTNPELNGRCPACRRIYEDKNIEYTTMSPDELRAQQLQIERKKKEKLKQEKEKKDAEQAKRHHLAGMRVIQKNLVYVVGLHPNCSPEDLPGLLRSDKYFGQYGKILKIVINKKNPPAQSLSSSSSSHSPYGVYGVYVSFARKEDASRCILAVDGSVSDGRVLKAAHGTTKYCSAYLRGQPCQNPNCMFLHEPGEEADSYTRQDLSTRSINNKLQERSATNGLIAPPPNHEIPSSDEHQQHQHSFHHSSSYGTSAPHRSPSNSPQTLASQLHHEASLPPTVAWAKSVAPVQTTPVVQTAEILSSFPSLGDALSQKPPKPQQARKKEKKENGKDKETVAIPLDDTLVAFKNINESIQVLNSMDEFSYSIKPQFKSTSKRPLLLFHQCKLDDFANKSLEPATEEESKKHLLRLIDNLLFTPFSKNYNTQKELVYLPPDSGAQPTNRGVAPQAQQIQEQLQDTQRFAGELAGRAARQQPQQQPQQQQPQQQQFFQPQSGTTQFQQQLGANNQTQQTQQAQQFLQQQFLQQQQIKLQQQLQGAGAIAGNLAAGTPPPGLFNASTVAGATQQQQQQTQQGGIIDGKTNSSELLNQLMGKKVVA